MPSDSPRAWAGGGGTWRPTASYFEEETAEAEAWETWQDATWPQMETLDAPPASATVDTPDPPELS